MNKLEKIITVYSNFVIEELVNQDGATVEKTTYPLNAYGPIPKEDGRNIVHIDGPLGDQSNLLNLLNEGAQE